MDIKRFDELREKALKMISDPELKKKFEKVLSKDFDLLLEELQIYQAELEVQNEELLEQQQELTASQNRLSHLFDQAPVGYLILDKQNKIIKINDKSAVLLSGGNISQVIDKNFERFIRHGIGRFLDWMFQSDDLPLELEIVGSDRNFWVRLDRAEWVDEEEQYTLLTMVNIDPEIEAKNELMKARSDLEKLNRDLLERVDLEVSRNLEKEKMLVRQAHFASLGEMVNAIANQWRQPLNVIGILIQDLEETYREKELDEEYLVDITRRSMREIEHLAKTINVFRNFFTTEKKVRVFWIEDIFRDLENLLEASMKYDNIDLEFSIKNNSIITGYPNDLKQSLINIVNNAREAILNRGKPGGKIDIQAHSDSHYVYITIGDNGGGIPADVFDRILEPYFTTKSEEMGNGIGLYITQSIIESSLDGELIYENVDDGAQFTIRLPIKEDISAV